MREKIYPIHMILLCIKQFPLNIVQISMNVFLKMTYFVQEVIMLEAIELYIVFTKTSIEKFSFI